MPWYNFSEIIKNRKAKREKKLEENNVEYIDGWKLLVRISGEKIDRMYEHPSLQKLWKIYNWYLTRNSEKYSIETRMGYEIINRFDVESVKLIRTKLIKNDWIKENNDETKTD